MPKQRILFVDDNEIIRKVMKLRLESSGFEVFAASGVCEALNLIATQNFEVLITDLHMPDAGDGFAVVTAMRHSQPEALTLVVSGFPDVKEAMAAIVLQADEVLMKPFNVDDLGQLIENKLREVKRPAKAPKESVASILERDSSITIGHWLKRVNENAVLSNVPLSDGERTGHLPELTREIVGRLRDNRVMDTVASASPAAVFHGELRLKQGYTAPMMVQESRLLQVCIFETIQRNLGTVNFSLVLPDVMLIADEVDSQLTQSVESFLTAQRALISPAA